MSSTKRIVACIGLQFDPESKEYRMLTAAGVELRPIAGRTEDDIIAGAQGAVGIFCFGLAPFTRRVFASLPDLRVLLQCTVGYDQVDVAAATEHGVMVANSPRFCREEVSDHAAMLILACVRRLGPQVSSCHEHGWNRTPAVAAMGMTRRLREQTIGFVAFGAIARMTADKLRGFGARYLAYDPYLSPDVAKQHGADLVSLEELCRQSDYVSMHALLNAETRHLLREEHFRLMKPTAYFVNTSRGATVNEAALIRALKEGWIAGAALDVLEVEPPAPDNPLLTMPNVLLTCHTAGYSEDSRRDNIRQTTEDMLRALSGEWPLALVNPEVKERVRQ